MNCTCICICVLYCIWWICVPYWNVNINFVIIHYHFCNIATWTACVYVGFHVLRNKWYILVYILHMLLLGLKHKEHDGYSKDLHYNDVIMGTIASQITSLTTVYSIVYSDADQRKHQSSASLALVWGIHRGPVNSPHKWPVTWKMFPFDDVITWKVHMTPNSLGSSVTCFHLMMSSCEPSDCIIVTSQTHKF